MIVVVLLCLAAVGVVIARMGIAAAKLHQSNVKARSRGLP